MTLSGSRETPPRSPNPLASTSLSFGYALRSEQFGLELTAERLRVEDSGQAFLTLAQQAVIMESGGLRKLR